MNNNSLKILNLFRKQLVDFFDELIIQFPEEKTLILIRILINDQLPIQDIMDIFIKTILPHKELIDKKDEQFLLSNALFTKLEKTDPNLFKRIWTSKKLDNEERDIIWKWFNSFVVLSDRYNKLIVTN